MRAPRHSLSVPRPCADTLFLPELWRGFMATCRLTLVGRRDRISSRRPFRSIPPLQLRQFSDGAARCLACDLCRETGHPSPVPVRPPIWLTVR